MWSSGGRAWIHSIEDLWYDENKAGRPAMNLSHTIKIMNTTEIKEIIDPIEEIVFQAVYASG